MESINSISDPQEKIAKYNEMVASLKSFTEGVSSYFRNRRGILMLIWQLCRVHLLLLIELFHGWDRIEKPPHRYDSELKQIVADLQNCSNKTDLTRLQQQFRGNTSTS